VIKIFAMQKIQAQFPNGTPEEMKAYFTQVMGDERGGKEFYIIGRIPAFNVGDRCVFQQVGHLIADALIVTAPTATIDPARSEPSFMRLTDIHYYDNPVPMADLQERHRQIHGGRIISTRGGSMLTREELEDVRRRAEVK